MKSCITKLIQSALARAGFVAWCLACSTPGSAGLVVCDGTPVPVTLTASPLTLSVLSTNIATLAISLNHGVGNDTRLGLTYSGTASNGVDVALLPASVIIPAGVASAQLTVTPKTTYPYSSKTLTVTLVSSDNVCVFIGNPQAATITLLGFSPPILAITSLDVTNINLSWWPSVSGYVLQSTTQMSPANWITMTNVPVLDQGTNHLTLNNEQPSMFYRLMKP